MALSWTQLFPVHSPANRRGQAVAYDPVRKKTVLFSGEDEGTGTVFYDTWEWDGVDWTQITTVHTPGTFGNQNTGVGFQVLSYHPGTGKIVLIWNDYFFDIPGGFTVNHWEIWTYDGIDWTQENPSISFSNVRGAGTDFGNDKIVLLSDDTPNKTWLWDGSDLTLQATTHDPGFSFTQSVPIDYDHVNNYLVAYNGIQAWKYDATDWTQLSLITSPSNRGNASLAWNYQLNKLVTFGGSAAPSSNFNDTWELDATTWTFLLSAGTARSVQLSTDPVTNGNVFFGGYDNSSVFGLGDTWLLSDSALVPSTFLPQIIRRS